LIAFVIISDKKATFIFFKMAIHDHFGCLKLIFAISIKTQLIFLKIAIDGHFGCSKIIFVYIYHHFRSKCNVFFQNGWQPFSMSKIRFCLHFSSFQINTWFIGQQKQKSLGKLKDHNNIWLTRYISHKHWSYEIQPLQKSMTLIDL
jgi:hypothetical protein